MNDTTLKQVIEAHRILEECFAKQIAEFERRFGITITSVEVPGSRPVGAVPVVRIRVEIGP